MNIYIASYFDTRVRLYPVRDAIVQMGHVCTSRWLDESCTVVDMNYNRAAAVRDMLDVKRSDIIILDTLDETPRGGREVEWGIALTRTMTRVIVGPKRNVFHELAQHHFASWGECLLWLRELGSRSSSPTQGSS